VHGVDPFNESYAQISRYSLFPMMTIEPRSGDIMKIPMLRLIFGSDLYIT